MIVEIGNIFTSVRIAAIRFINSSYIKTWKLQERQMFLWEIFRRITIIKGFHQCFCLFFFLQFSHCTIFIEFICFKLLSIFDQTLIPRMTWMSIFL